MQTKINGRIDCLVCGDKVLPDDLNEHNRLKHEVLPSHQKNLLKTKCDLCGKIMQLDSLKRHFLCHHTSQET